MHLRLLHIVLVIAGSVLFFTSCNNDEDATGNSVRVPVQFGSLITDKTLRTLTTGNGWSTNDRIGIYMIKRGQSLAISAIAEGAENREYMALTGNTPTSSFSPIENTIYYPQDGSKVYFIAYYPYRLLISNYTYSIDTSDQTNLAAIDLLYADSHTTQNSDYDKNSNTVDLSFKHLLSKLTFGLIAGSGVLDLNGVTIEITNLNRKADLNLTNGLLENLSSTGSVRANRSIGSAIILPQIANGSKLIITLADGKSVFEWNFPANTKLEAGNNYRYDITVNKTGIKVSTTNITDWEGTTDQPTEGTAS